MSAKLFYFTGTGNTLAIAKSLAVKIGGASIEPMTNANPVLDNTATTVGIIFPVYGWGMPKAVRDFVNRMENLSGKYIFAVCTYGGTLFGSLKSPQNALKKKGAALNAGFAIRMPVNYIQVFTVLSKTRQEKILAKANEKIDRLAAIVKNRENAPIEVWPTPVINELLLVMNKAMIDHISESDKAYWTTDACNGCGVCAKICPVKNITMNDNRPAWNHGCEQCLGCLHWCPQAAVQFGKTPPKRGRYHHPEITVKDMMAQQKKMTL
jgi:ferredoxin